MSYRNLLRNLESLPEAERQLAAGVYFFDEGGVRVCGCVLGKGLPGIRQIIDADPALMDSSIVDLPFVSRRLALLEGMTVTEARSVQNMNDAGVTDIYSSRSEHLPMDNDPASRRARYVRVVDWLRERVAAETAR